ncbi:C40 family peptidase [Planomonospora parontospora]|uniref:C40 family peptidase n=1 Tax=Planomonospora parontospora TaxID=58119 RepID=UPI0019C7F6A8|nr:C40 family peptidase [Planomonospora parontospora]GGL42566.1 lipoprotein [Planomonospora parontospora subsp. antibiotica]GII18378.1 lipoprotein [Planomonospora parontospora subsp. antibiotica]
MKSAAAGAALLLLVFAVFIAAAASIFTGSSGGFGCVMTTPGSSGTQKGGPVAGLDAEQGGNAALIVQTGLELGLPARAAVIAVATALQESQLRNLPYGHLDSLGLFQQRPSQGWGTPEQILDPRYAARQFYTRLIAVPGWEQLPLTRAAQAVQRSAFPDAYARWEPLAQQTVDALTASCVALIPGEQAAAVIAYAQAQLGKPYLWGAEGPASFDCSGLTMRAYQAAGITIPRVAADQWRHGLPVPPGQEQPGDLVFFRMEASGPGHVGIVIGGGRMIHAPRTGDFVKIAPYQRPDLVGFTRPAAERVGHPSG